MALDSRSLIFFVGNVILLYLTMLVNSTICTWSLHLVLIGPMLVLPALFLSHRSFFICTLFTGLWIDAALPAPNGLFTIILLATGSVLFIFRVRFRAEYNYHPIVIAHAINLICCLLLATTAGTVYFHSPGYWLHVFTTVVISHIALLLVAPWFFDLMRLLMELLHQDSNPNDLPRP